MDSLTSSFTPLCAPNLRPAGTSFQRKEGSIHLKRPTFSPLPLEGAAWRSETGLAPPYVGNAFPLYRYPHHFRASPFIKISAERCSGAFVSSDLCKNVFPSVSPAFHTACPIRPYGAPSPRGEGSDTRIPSSKKTSHYPCDPIRSPYRHPERSRGIFIALPPYAHMRPHANDTLALPFSLFSHSRLTALQEGSLHFGPHDTQERR